MDNMTPEQKIKATILKRAIDNKDFTIKEQVITENNIDYLYEENDLYWSHEDEMRCGEMETNIPTEFSRHYESKSVAAKMFDGSWVGWTYWYGGGKHGEPESIDWMSGAYELECIEEEKLVVVKTFIKK